MENEDKYNLYTSIDSLDLSVFEQYKYLTENDQDIVKLKEQVRGIVVRKNLSSIMNDTKWLKLQKGIENLPFPPAYNEKLVQWDNAQFRFENLKSEPTFTGNWSSYWEEGLPIFFTIEWLEIRPILQKHQGRLVAPKIIDETKECIQLLNSLHIPFEQENGTVIIYGYK